MSAKDKISIGIGATNADLEIRLPEEAEEDALEFVGKFGVEVYLDEEAQKNSSNF